jgi:hypothetical protein
MGHLEGSNCREAGDPGSRGRYPIPALYVRLARSLPQRSLTAEREMDAEIHKMMLRLLAGPVCLAVLILILAGQVDFLVLAR